MTNRRHEARLVERRTRSERLKGIPCQPNGRLVDCCGDPDHSIGEDRKEASRMCEHLRSCPTASSPDALQARVRSGHPEQGWSLLCNGVIIFDDGGALYPDGRTFQVHRLVPPHAA
jgi:hypothetical protein